MKKFLNRIIIFCSFEILLLYAIDYGYSEVMMRSNYRPVEAWYDLMHGKIDADVIIMGNSRAWVHISPKILDSILCVNTYNLGIDGSAINRQIQKYNLFRKYNTKPKLIIQNIDLSSLAYTIGYERDQFFPYFWNTHIREDIMKTEPFSAKEKYLPLYRYGEMSCPHFSPRKLEKGYHGKMKSWNGKPYFKLDSISFITNDTTVKMFDEFLSQTKREGIKVVFVYTPIFIGATKKTTNLNEMYAFYKKLADKYDIQILDYNYMGLCNDTAYFYNAMHLNKQGAEIFSDSLANDMKRLRILN